MSWIIGEKDIWLIGQMLANTIDGANLMEQFRWRASQASRGMM